MHWWVGDISARDGIETNLCSTLSQPNNFSLYTVFVFWMWSFKENKAATYFAGRVCFVVYVCHMFFISTMKCVYLGFFIVKTSLSLLNGSKQCDCGSLPHQGINIYGRARENELSLQPGDNELRGFIRRRSKGIIRFNAPFHFQTV